MQYERTLPHKTCLDIPSHFLPVLGEEIILVRECVLASRMSMGSWRNEFHL